MYRLRQIKRGGLARMLTLKQHTSVTLTVNLEVPDKLCNGQIGTIQYFKRNTNGEIVVIYLKMDDDTIGKNS